MRWGKKREKRGKEKKSGIYGGGGRKRSLERR